MYTYPEALNAMERLARDYFAKACPNTVCSVRVCADSLSGTASVDWYGNPNTDRYVDICINMPVKPASYRMSASEFEHWAAYLLHEVGHPLHTDMSVWRIAVKTKRHKLLNAFEDV